MNLASLEDIISSKSVVQSSIIFIYVSYARNLSTFVTKHLKQKTFSSITRFEFPLLVHKKMKKSFSPSRCDLPPLCCCVLFILCKSAITFMLLENIITTYKKAGNSEKEEILKGTSSMHKAQICNISEYNVDFTKKEIKSFRLHDLSDILFNPLFFY